jgi:ATP-dependent helicase/nuclease subunit A
LKKSRDPNTPMLFGDPPDPAPGEQSRPIQDAVEQPSPEFKEAETSATPIREQPIQEEPGRPVEESDALSDLVARKRIRNDLDTTLVVEAAAGTGKTTELVRRIIAVIKSGRASLNEIVAVTFTDAAAGELKLRLRAEIERERQDPDCSSEARAFLDNALPQLEEARIGTIHSFCSDLLRERPVEAGIDPLFEVGSEELTGPLLNLAFDNWFEQQLADPSAAVRRVLRRRPRREFSRAVTPVLAQRPRTGEGPRRRLRAAAQELVDRRDFPAPWRRSGNFDREHAIDALVAEMKELGALALMADPTQWFTKSLLALKQFVDDLTRTEGESARDYDGIEARLFDFLPSWKSNYVAYYTRDSFPKAEVMARRDALKANIADFVERSGADLAPQLRDELWSVIEEYEQLKERAGCLDYLDLLLRARNLVRDNSDVRAELQRRFTRIFVDEFQDTDPLQAEILVLLAANDPQERDWRRAKPVPGKLFVVGDPKQSIYRFRRADVALYDAVKKQVRENGGDLLELNVSFRSVPEIQQAVNAAFSRVMGDSSLETQSTQASYVPLAPHRSGIQSQPAIIALPVPEPYGDYGRVVNWKIDESLPDAVAAFVDWLVHKSGWTVTEREHPYKRVQVRPRHVCLLFRRFRSFGTDMTRPYVRALEARRLPHLLVGGSGFHAREEVEAIRNALAAIERPDDELAVFATLRGPLFALTDSQLLAHRDCCSTLHPFKKPPDDLPESLSEVTDALAILRDLHRGRNRRPIADTIGRLLASTRAHAGFANWSTGEQALANVTRLMDMARRAERNGLISFRSFVDWLVDQAENGEAGDAPIIEEGVDGVRIMTVHKAKGLEFPIVILADMTAKETREASRWNDPSRGLSVMRLAGCAPPELVEHVDEETRCEREEAVRVLYVAATRARDLLVVSAIGDSQFDGWLGALNPAIYPAVPDSFKPETNQPEGCPAFGSDNMIGRASGLLRPPGSVTPGLHKPEAGDHRVVWWDPSLLELGKQEDAGSRLNKLIAADEKGVRSEAGIHAHADWQKARASVRESGGVRSIRVATATEYARTIAGISADYADSADSLGASRTSDEQVFVESVDIDFSRPHGKRFGTLVHAVLSLVDLGATRAGVKSVAELQGRLLGSSTEEINAAMETVFRALSHPLLVRASAAAKFGNCRRESPVVLRLEDGSLVEGIVDLAFVDDSQARAWTAVDFKTDFEIGGRLEEYRSQVALYSEAIARATGLPCRGILLKI